MADPREAPAACRPSIDELDSSPFDDSIFDKVALPGSRRSSGEAGAAIVKERSDPEEEPSGDEDEEPASQREGLPPGFRMRHDTHYVDDLVTRNLASRLGAREARETDDRPASERASSRLSVPMSHACAQVGQSLDAIGACLRLFADAPRPAAEQVALDLISAEVARAGWFVQGLALLDGDPPVANVQFDLAAVVKRVVDTLGPGWTPRRSRVVVDSEPSLPHARGDESLAALAVAGILTALEAVTERVRDASIEVALRHEPGRVLVHVSQNVVRVPPSWRARFLDPSWTDRPGGRRTAVALAAARRVAELHSGLLTMTLDEAGGCRLALSLPRA